MEKPVIKFKKNAERTFGKIIIPKVCIEKFGYSYELEVYQDYMKLVPVKEK